MVDKILKALEDEAEKRKNNVIYQERAGDKTDYMIARAKYEQTKDIVKTVKDIIEKEGH